jgi:flagellar biosynthesis protein FlhG
VLSQRLGVLAYDLVVAADAASPRVPRIAESLSGCADRFLGAVLGDWALADPTTDPDEPVPAALRRLAAGQLGEHGDYAAAAEPNHYPAAMPAARGWTERAAN